MDNVHRYIIMKSGFVWLVKGQKGPRFCSSLKAVSGSCNRWILGLWNGNFLCVIYAQKTLATIRYKAVDTRSLNRVYFEGQNSILLPFHSLPCLPWQVYLSTCLLFSCRNVLNVTTLSRWERGEGGGGGGGGGKNAEDVVDRNSEWRLGSSWTEGGWQTFTVWSRCLFACCFSVIVVVIYLSFLHFTGHT